MSLPTFETIPRSSSVCVSKLARGEYKRLAAHDKPIGWYIACPECRLITVVLAEKSDAVERDRELVELGPWRCGKCKATYVIREGRYARLT